MSDYIARYANEHGADLDEAAAFESWYQAHFRTVSATVSIADAFRAWEAARSYLNKDERG